MSNANVDSTETVDQTGDLPDWQLVLLGLGIVAAFLGSILNGVAYALGATVAAGFIYYIAIRLADAVYQRFKIIQLSVIPHRVYIGICILSGLLSIPVAFVLQTPGNGAFLFFYGLFGMTALFGWGILKPLVNRARK